MMFPGIRTLENNELPGDGVYNPLAKAIRNMDSLSDNIVITMGANGGILFDWRPDLNYITRLANASILAAFGGTLSTSRNVHSLHVEGGMVLSPDMNFTVSGTTFSNVSAGRKVWCAISSSSASIGSGSSFPSFVTNSGASSVINVRLMETISSDNKLLLKYHHVGNIVFSITPYFWISGFDPTKKQSLDHAADGALEWTDYAECES